MGLLSTSIETLSSRSRRSSAAPPPKDLSEEDGRDADMSTLDKDEGNILLSLISQRTYMNMSA